jgi:hypothetical protein
MKGDDWTVNPWRKSRIAVLSRAQALETQGALAGSRDSRDLLMSVNSGWMIGGEPGIVAVSWCAKVMVGNQSG